ncbi:EAL domain-containing protein [Pseudoalteromonas phenolica]|uniref:EAL domain-containing protein n=1 Tax=Pseudoalteromonas phenolica TaxID=161398 RepID=UPI00110BC64D|nr:GGDEF domain-containing protein [Pseudoalteromonas phenolica]TMO54989.1 GGDEF domain-containing protein [Pseudoalteromonas phenolica]
MIRRTSPANLLFAGFFIFLTCLVGYVYYTYETTRTAIVSDIDERLLHAAKSAQLLLGEQYHDDLATIQPEQYKRLSKQLSLLADTLNVEYVYSMVYEQPFVLFTSSSYTKEDVQTDMLTRFLDPYPEATVINKSAFRSTEPVFEISEDQWGRFKTIFVPYISNTGKTYLVGADITMDSVQAQLNASVTRAILSGSFFFFIAVLVACFYFILYRKSLTTDPRTGFGNRIALEHDINQHKNEHLSLAIVEIHELENIVSFYGANVGDQVMSKVMGYFASQSSSVYVYRLATSKLVLFCDSERGEHFLSNLVQQFPASSPVLNRPHLYVQLNAGIAEGNKSLLLENAYVACRQAVQQKELVCIYSIDKHEAKQLQHARLAMAKTLNDAFSQNRVVVYFTPRCAPNHDNICQYLCNARVLDEQGGIITDNAFSEVVKQSRMEGQLTRHIFSQCVTRFRKSRTAWSIGLSYQDASDPQLIDFISQELRRYPQPSLITFELDEQDILDNFNAMAVAINILKSKGVKILVNSVSSGLLTVSRVMKLSIDAIKLDDGISNHLENDEQVLSFIEHLARLCRDREMHLIVGNVETELQYELLCAAGVTYLQGSYIGKATPHIKCPEEHATYQASA